jgi:hypothetical protein
MYKLLMTLALIVLAAPRSNKRGSTIIARKVVNFGFVRSLRVVTTRLVGKFEFNTPQTLFTFPLLPYSSGGVVVRQYDVTADGKKILTITTPAALRPRQIEIVTNWTNELTQLASARNKTADSDL